MRRIKFENDIFYHIYNRGLDKQNLFIDENDYLRFLCGIYYFNDVDFVPDNIVSKERLQGQTLEKSPNRKELIDLMCWCLMQNHYHLILRQKIANGITKFMRRIGTGYTMYINAKYEHSGHIFQGPFKAKPVNNNEYLQHLTRYIHLNPLDIHDSNWKEDGAKNAESSKKFVLKYKWSSLHNYLNTNTGNLILLTSPTYKEFLFTNEPSVYKDFLWDWLEKGIPSDTFNFSKV